jgi:arylsulfatase A-like enzyme
MVDFLDPAAVTLPRLLRKAGYATGHFGKWHMGGGRDVGDAPLPRAYGFDESLVSFEGLGDRLLDKGDGLADASAKLGRGEIRRVHKHEKTRIYVDRAIDFIRRHKDRPFYVNLWPNDVHDPFRPSPEQLEKFERFSDRPQWQRFLAVLDELDHQIGRLIDAIDRMGLGGKTMIILTGDNGPTAWPRYYRGGKGEGAAPGFTGGLRGRKWSLYEGGIREPLIIRWIGHAPAGHVNETTVAASIDLLSSLCALAGVELPKNYESDGVDLGAALLDQKDFTRSRPIHWEYNSLGGNIRPGLEKDRSPTLATRDGDWKLLINPDGSDVELYNLAADRDESDNLAARFPRRVARMRERLFAWYHSLPEPKGGLVRPRPKRP